MEELLKPTKIIKSKRKSIALQIKLTGEFIVRVPLKYNEHEINKFIQEKADWIIKKRKECYENAIVPIDLNKNNTISLLGQMYELQLTNIRNCKIVGNVIYISKNKPIEKLISFLKNYAKNYLNERVTIFSFNYNLPYTDISITSAKTCWGSCSFSNKLHFTYKLMLCPKEVVDYIIIHELCHTRIKNHSESYWGMVENFCPNYKQHERWLKQNRGIVNLI